MTASVSADSKPPSQYEPTRERSANSALFACCVIAAALVLAPASVHSAEAELGIHLSQPLGADGDSQEIYAEVSDSLFGINTTLRAQQKFRFDDQDRSLSLSGGRGLTERWALGADISVGLQQALYPNWSAGIYPTFAPGRGWVLGLGYRHSVYPDLQVDMLLPGIEYYFADYRLAYTLFVSRLSTDPTLGFSHAIKLDHYYDERSRIGIGASLGAERETSPEVAETLVTDIVGVNLDGRHWWNERWGSTWMLGTQYRSSDTVDATHLSAQIGLRRQFW